MRAVDLPIGRCRRKLRVAGCLGAADLDEGAALALVPEPAIKPGVKEEERRGWVFPAARTRGTATALADAIEGAGPSEVAAEQAYSASRLAKSSR